MCWLHCHSPNRVFHLAICCLFFPKSNFDSSHRSMFSRCLTRGSRQWRHQDWDWNLPFINYTISLLLSLFSHCKKIIKFLFFFIFFRHLLIAFVVLAGTTQLSLNEKVEVNFDLMKKKKLWQVGEERKKQEEEGNDERKWRKVIKTTSFFTSSLFFSP